MKNKFAPSRRLALRTILLAMGFCAANAFAQAWPAKVITLIVPFPPGGYGDTILIGWAG